MSHRKLRELLDLHVDGTLDAARRVRLEAHLEECDECRSELRQLRRTVELLYDLRAVDAPPHLADRVIATVRERESSRTPWLRRLALPLSAAAAGLAALAVIQGVEISVVLPLEDWVPDAHPDLATRHRPGRGVGFVVPESSPPREQEATAPGVGQVARRGSSPRLQELDRAAASPMPPWGSCLAPSEAEREVCARWHSWHLGMAMSDASAFLAEMDRVPPPDQDRWIGRISDLAANSGAAVVVAERLRSLRDPRALRLVPRFQRVSHR